jgi:hypothetical protein
VGVVHSKFQNAKLKIEERMVDVEVKFVLPRVWIQFTGLSSHLRDFLVVWAVGSILGVSKDVDMEFTRHHGISRLQVAVTNPNLIPQKVNIVIGKNVYKLKFHVERNVQEGGPHLMDMDDNQVEDGAGRSDKVGTNPGEKQSDKGPTGASDGIASGVNLSSGGGRPAGRTLPVCTMQLPMGLLLEGNGLGTEAEPAENGTMVLPPLEADPCIEEKFSVGKQEEGAVEDSPDDEVSSQANSMHTAELEKALKEWGDEENSRVPSAEELAAIPEASPDQSSTRRSKRRAAAAN